MAPQQPTVGLAGSRIIDEGLQSSDKKTVTKMEFPSGSCTATGALKGIPREGATDYKGPKLGDCYADSVEDTRHVRSGRPPRLVVAARIHTRRSPAPFSHSPPVALFSVYLQLKVLSSRSSPVWHLHAAVRAVSVR